MCGPLLLALPRFGNSGLAVFASRLTYNFGRVATYTLFGVIFGLFGKTLALAGLQRWVSITAGAAVLLGLFASTRFAPRAPLLGLVKSLKSAFGTLMGQRNFRGILLLGMLNGLLPCGLVYAACAGAIAAGSVSESASQMAAFGIGTMPMMLGIGLVAPRLRFFLGRSYHALLPASIAIAGVLLILRGLALGIPYLSPDLAHSTGHCPACH
jgi:sulfite exporter TauE/SafE